MASTTPGPSTSTIQAPTVNFVTTTTSRTAPVARAPTMFRVAEVRHPGSRSRSQWRTMPSCDNENAVKTPTMYSATSTVTRAPAKAISRAAASDRAMMPLEKTNRSPRADS